MEIMKVNSRLPDYLQGDLWAGIAAARLGERRIVELVAQVRQGHVPGGDGARSWTTASRSSRRALAELPKGRFTLEEEQDNGLVYRAAIEITDEEFIVDLRDNPDQDPGPNNASRDGSMIAAQMIFKNATDPGGVANAGTSGRCELLTRPGLGLRRPAAGRVRDLLRGRDPALRRALALPGAAPGRAAAGRQLRLDLRHVHRRAATPNRPPLHDHRAAGRRLGRLRRGGRQQRACSAASTATPSTARPRSPRRATGSTSTASRSTTSPAARAATGAARGSSSTTASASDGCFFTCAYSRYMHPVGARGRPRGLAELHRGDPGRRIGRDARRRHRAAVNEGDVIRIHTASGGGYGDPLERPLERVLEDVRDGYLSEEQARSVYGYDGI